MPQRASRQQVAASFGKMVFGTNDPRRIQHKMDKIGKGKLEKALVQSGLDGPKSKRLAQALSGEKHINLSQFELRKAATAMQRAGLARKALSPEQMVFRAAKDAQDQLKAQAGDDRGLTPEQIRKRMVDMEEQRKREGEKKEEGFAVDQYGDSRSIMERARGGTATSNHQDVLAGDANVPPAVQSATTPGATIRGLRAWQQSMQLQPKMNTSLPSNPSLTPPPTFQS